MTLYIECIGIGIRIQWYAVLCSSILNYVCCRHTVARADDSLTREINVPLLEPLLLR
jgi:hypothetical protein